ncbi:MAG TPA: amidohydrolase family protein [Verrucomicrobiae bacterium]|jgi:cytosine/adenosine deaminase-related metal-dependent hydrolase|nr:amidohydrolase family protein [Verrucomicrobiae bacterium]
MAKTFPGQLANQPLVLRARALLPITAPPIENGAVVIYGDRIIAADAWRRIPRELTSSATATIVDLGDVALLPGLVNAHCHLDYTDMAGFWPSPKKFTDWIPWMLAAKAEWSYSNYACSWLNGAKMLLHSGTTSVADIEAAPELLPDVWNSTPLRVFSFLEMTSVRSKRDPAEILDEALKKIESLVHHRCTAALSPHAPYSTSAELLRLCARAAGEKKLRTTVHVAESLQEFEMFAHARGEMFDWLKRNGRDNSDCGKGTPFQHLDRAGLANGSFIAVHANYLDDRDFDLFPKRGVSLVHCPRSHHYFQHQTFPLQKLLAANVNVCLGTDSLATVAKNGKDHLELNLFSEMQAFSRSNPGCAPETILKMATTNGARALGLAGKIGELSSYAFADLIAVPFTGRISGACDAVLNFHGRVNASMIAGQWAVAPGQSQ